METVINFFTLRPTFTHFGLKVVWYLYLLNTVVQTYTTVSSIFQVLAQRGVHVELWSPNFIPLLLGLVAQLALGPADDRSRRHRHFRLADRQSRALTKTAFAFAVRT